MIIKATHTKVIPFFYITLYCIIGMAFLGQECAMAQSTFTEKLSSLGIKPEECVDWSDSSNIVLPMPTCAYLNVTGISAFPTQFYKASKAWLDFYDGNGNHFKKRAKVYLQGNNSVKWPKRNFKADFCDDEWLEEVTPDIKFGNWVEQDGFHFKAFYQDYFRGIGIIGYKLYDQITIGRGEYGRIWERADNIKKPDVNALCHPDAFPCIVYLNNKFYGIYCWQLKKHRKNMNMKKHTPEHIHLDGRLVDNTTIFGGTIDWSKIEVRTPKDLYDMDGKEYSGEVLKELIDETSPYYDLDTDDEKTKEYKQVSAQVKKYLKQLSKYNREIQSVINQKPGTQAIREAIEERFDVTSMIDYVIHNLVTNNTDGNLKNYQWLTYDGKKWFVAPYDLDITFGHFWNFYIIFAPQYYYIYPMSTWNFNKSGPLKWVELYFNKDTQNRYAYLRDQGLLNAETVASFFDTWYYAVGEENYNDEWKRWPKCPALKETLPNSQWSIQPYTYSKYTSTADYNDTVTYATGKTCRAEGRIWKALTTVKGVKPYKQRGYKDSLERIYPWMKDRLVSLDKRMNYTFTSIPVSYTLSITSVGWSTLCVPFKFDIPDGLEIYSVLGRDKKGQLVKEQVGEVEAYRPYLVKGAPGDYVLIGESEEPNEDAEDYLINGCMHGTLAGKFVPQGNYVLQNHNGSTAFYRVEKNGTVKIGPNRAYLELPEGENAAESVSFEDEGSMTAVAMSETHAEIEAIYNAYGVRISRIEKGVNIVKYSNGRTVKVVVN